MPTERQYPLETVMDRNEVIARLNTNRKLRKAEQVADEEGETRMKSKYHTIIKSLLKAQGIDAEPDEVLAKVERLTGVDFGSLTMYNGITKCIVAGINIAATK